MPRRKRRNLRKEDREALDVDITSLLDILVILLVFLLKSYNASDLKIDLAKQVTLPDSRSSELGNDSIIVQVSSERDIYINNEKIGALRTANKKISFLYDKLAEHKKGQEQELEKLRGPASSTEKDILKRKKEKMKKINIVLDKSLPYSVLSQIMHTSALAGFPEFKFIVQAKNE